MIKLCHYLTDNFEDKFMSASGGGVGFNFSSQMSYLETATMMSDVELKSLYYVFPFEFYVIN